MRNTLLIVLTMTGLLAGCHQNQARYALRLREAHEALCSGSPERAESCLADAAKFAAEHKITPASDAKILLAEVRLAQGDVPGALSAAGEVLSNENTEPQDRARAEEIVGKAALRQGRFTEAQSHFVAAESSYEADADMERIVDLIHFTRGLSAYGTGDVEVARKYWRTIRDPDLRYSVDKALQDIKSSPAR